MSDRPIIFSAAMVRALLDGRKTQTRRILRAPKGAWIEDGQIWANCDEGPDTLPLPYRRGRRLWVREAHALVPASAYRMSAGIAQAVNPEDRDCAAIYREGFDRSQGGIRWRPSIHMPRWASRLTLHVSEVRVQRLQEISPADCLDEGWPGAKATGGVGGYRWFIDLWNSLHGADAWDANPWCVAISFSVQKGNIDAL